MISWVVKNWGVVKVPYIVVVPEVELIRIASVVPFVWKDILAPLIVGPTPYWFQNIALVGLPGLAEFAEIFIAPPNCKVFVDCVVPTPIFPENYDVPVTVNAVHELIVLAPTPNWEYTIKFPWVL